MTESLKNHNWDRSEYVVLSSPDDFFENIKRLKEAPLGFLHTFYYQSLNEVRKS